MDFDNDKSEMTDGMVDENLYPVMELDKVVVEVVLEEPAFAPLANVESMGTVVAYPVDTKDMTFDNLVVEPEKHNNLDVALYLDKALGSF